MAESGQGRVLVHTYLGHLMQTQPRVQHMPLIPARSAGQGPWVAAARSGVLRLRISWAKVGHGCVRAGLIGWGFGYARWGFENARQGQGGESKGGFWCTRTLGN